MVPPVSLTSAEDHDNMCSGEEWREGLQCVAAQVMAIAQALNHHGTPKICHEPTKKMARNVAGQQLNCIQASMAQSSFRARYEDVALVSFRKVCVMTGAPMMTTSARPSESLSSNAKS